MNKKKKKMGKSEIFQKQCEQMEKAIEDMSDWEKKFYLYTLIRWYQENTNNKRVDTPDNVYGYAAAVLTANIKNHLKHLEQILVYDLF